MRTLQSRQAELVDQQRETELRLADEHPLIGQEGSSDLQISPQGLRNFKIFLTRILLFLLDVVDTAAVSLQASNNLDSPPSGSFTAPRDPLASNPSGNISTSLPSIPSPAQSARATASATDAPLASDEENFGGELMRELQGMRDRLSFLKQVYDHAAASSGQAALQEDSGEASAGATGGASNEQVPHCAACNAQDQMTPVFQNFIMSYCRAKN